MDGQKNIKVQYSVQYTLLLLYLILMLCNLSIKLYSIYACYANITLCDVIYSVHYYLWFSVTMVGLGTYYLRIRQSTYTYIYIYKYVIRNT
jgi:hypothetical protein